MTTPNQQGQPLPEGSMQSYGSWNAVQNQSETGWKDVINSQWEGKFDPIGGGVNFLIVIMLKLLASLLNMVPIVGDDLAEVVNNIADGINATNNRAVDAQSSANNAQTAADTAQSNAEAANTRATNAETAAVNALAVANSAQTNAGTAVTQAQAAANAVAAASEKADRAYENASYWEAECVVASSGVVLGVNELNIGLCQNVPDGKIRKITDIHIALLQQPAGIQIQTKKYDAAGTTNSVIHTATLTGNVTRVNYNNLNLNVLDKERVFWNVVSVTGSVAPTILQCLVFGVIIDSDI